MYCKIKGDPYKKLNLPKANSLECGCLLPLKHAKVDLLVGKGVFKIACQKEELILFSTDGGSTSEEWVEAIQVTLCPRLSKIKTVPLSQFLQFQKAIIQHKKDASTLRKESSRREPLKRPGNVSNYGLSD